jgi:acyl-CoA thioester hydrolase
MGERNKAHCHFEWPVRVYWEDTDAGGIVFYVNYLKFMERARSEWLRGVAPSQEQMRASHGVFVVSDTRVRYLKPARLDDLLQVTVSLKACGRATFEVAQQVWRGNDLLAEGDIRVGWVATDSNGGFKPARMPQVFWAALSAALSENLAVHG